MKKDTAIKREIKKLNRILTDIPEDKKEMVEGLVQNAAFMAVTLRELQADITENGAVITVQTGNGYETTKDNPAQKAYTTMVARYAAIIDQLDGFLPSTKAKEVSKAGDLLKAFIASGKPE